MREPNIVRLGSRQKGGGRLFYMSVFIHVILVVAWLIIFSIPKRGGFYKGWPLALHHSAGVSRNCLKIFERMNRGESVRIGKSTAKPYLHGNKSECAPEEMGALLDDVGDYMGAMAFYEHALQHTKELGHTYLLHERLYNISARLNLLAPMAHHAQKAFLETRRSDLMIHLAQHYEAVGEVDIAVLFYGAVCRPDLTPQEYREEMKSIDRRLLWPNEFPPSYLDDFAAFEATLNDPESSDDTKEDVHWAMASRAKPVLRCGEEIFRREGPFMESMRDPDQQLEYYYATPSILPHPTYPDEDHLVLIRLVNYRLDNETRYYTDYLPPGDTSGVIRSSSVMYWGRNATKGVEVRANEEIFKHSFSQYVGMEDARLFQMDTGHVRVTWVSWEYAAYVGEGSRMVSGLLDADTHTLKVDHVFSSPYNRTLEKNWVLFQIPGGPLRFVYAWHPLEVATIERSGNRSTLRLKTTIQTPAAFRYIRGSSNGVLYQDELWFMVHGTTWRQGPGRTYYHRIVVLDPETFRMKRYTYPIRLESEDQPVEFSLGMTIDAKACVTIAYSVNDGSAVLRRIPLWKIETLMTSTP